MVVGVALVHESSLWLEEKSMGKKRNKILSAVRREQAEDYLLLSLVAFAATVVITRVFLELAGYPQIGNDVLHIAHALWGGLLLFVAALLPLALSNRWAIQASALFGGVGTGLFIDEVGKFITQANDYFYPPSLSIIYGFFLLTVVIYLVVRRPRPTNPRRAMYRVLERLQDVLDKDLDTEEADQIKVHLAIARQSDRAEIVSLADAIGDYVQSVEQHLPAAKPNPWRRFVHWVDSLGQRLGRRAHRAIVSGLLVLWVAFVVGYIVTMLSGTDLDSHIVQWRVPLIAIQSAVGALMIVAVIAWLRRNEERGLTFAVNGFLLSLVALQLLYFYLTQFAAISATLIQLAFLQVLYAYRRWYLRGQARIAESRASAQ